MGSTKNAKINTCQIWQSIKPLNFVPTNNSSFKVSVVVTLLLEKGSHRFAISRLELRNLVSIREHFFLQSTVYVIGQVACVKLCLNL